MRTVLALAGLLLAPDARADCTYHNGYYDPAVHGACVAETTVPEGCPVHAETPAGTVPEVTLYRGAQRIDATPTANPVASYQVAGSFVDPFDCACAMTPGAMLFDRFAIAIPEAVAGDVVALAPGQVAEPRSIQIGPPGPCPAPQFEDAIHIATQCDRCPVGDDPTDDAAPHSGGCATGGGAGALVGLLFLRRRRAR